MSSTTTARTAAAGPGGAGPLKLKFIFANYDGVVVEYQAEPSTKIKDLKAELVGRWPSGVDTVTDLSHVRLICMGFGILPDTKTLTECRVPRFDSHPTPVNVSVRPKDVRMPQVEGAPAAKINQGGDASPRACCTIS